MTQPAPSSGGPDDAAPRRAAAPAPAESGAPLSGESELLIRLRLGDAAAFERLFHTYYEPLCAFVLGYVRTAAVAEDVVQETFARLWERRSEWEVRGSVRSYLYSAVRNRALTHLRHARVVARAQERALRAAALGGRAAAPADERVRMDELAQALARAIEGLPARRRQVYTLRWQHGLALAEIAGVMDVTVKCVEAQLAAATKTIRAALAEFF